MNIAVIAGNIGDQVARELARQGRAARRLKRGRGPAAPATAGTVEVDFSREEEICRALDGVELFLSVSPLVPELVELTARTLRAAQAAGVRHVVRLSARGAAPDGITMGRLHHAAEQVVRDSGMSWTIVRPATFMQNYLGQAATISSQRAFPSGLGDGRVPYVDVRDIAAVAAEALVDGTHAGKTYEVSGSEALSDPDAARILSEVVGRQIRVIDVTDDDMARALRGLGLDDWTIGAITELSDVSRRGLIAQPADGVATVLHRPPITFRQFVTDHRDLFTA
jgi:uncharacterized protein YbjT (DUF2867 family)